MSGSRARPQRSAHQDPAETAICGTDMHIYNWDEWAQKTIPVPMVVGHEYVERWSPSARKCAASPSAIASPAKAISPAATAATRRAGRTHLCRNTIGVGVNRPGSFAEYLVIPAFQRLRAAGQHPR